MTTFADVLARALHTVQGGKYDSWLGRAPRILASIAADPEAVEVLAAALHRLPDRHGATIEEFATALLTALTEGAETR